MRLFAFAPRQPLTGVALSAALGVVIADLLPLALGWWFGVAGVATALLLLSRKTWSCWLMAATVFGAVHSLRVDHHPAARFARELGVSSKPVRASGIVWSEPTTPTGANRRASSRFQVKLSRIELDGVTRPAEFLVNVTWPGGTPRYGDRITLAGAARNIEAARNPGEFDLARFLRRQGIYSEIGTRYASDCAIVGHGAGNPFQAFGFAARRWMQKQLQRDLEDAPEISALISSMVLGLKGETPGEMKELFQRTGTLHLFAVSGLNIAMLGSLVWLVLKPLRVHRAAAVFVTIPVLAAYAVVTGLSASCVRATIMGTVILLAYVFDRRPVLYNSLSAAALAILAWDTNQLFSPGFQFSFALVFAIAYLAFRFQRRVEPFGRPDPFFPRPLWRWHHKARAKSARAFASAAGVTLAAWAGSLLFTIGYFHLFSLASIVANLIAVPLAFAVLGLGLLSVLSSPVMSAASVLANNANWLCAHLLLRTVQLCAQIPGGNVYVELPRPGKVPACEILVFDFQGGGAAHLRSGQKDWLLDCGPKRRYEKTILPYLRSRGVNQLDALLLTHGDAQHIGAAIPIVDDFQPRMVIDAPLLDRSPTRRGFHRELASLNRAKTFVRAGDSFVVSREATLHVLYPPKAHRRSLADDKALVLRLEGAGSRVLFMSDSGFATEQWLIGNVGDLRADVLVKGQHGKDPSGTLDFLAKVQPRAVICAGPDMNGRAGNLDEWERTVDAQNIALFRQDRTGAVRIVLDDGLFEIRSYLDRQSFRSKAR